MDRQFFGASADRKSFTAAVSSVLQSMGVSLQQLPSSVRSNQDLLASLLFSAGICYREVVLNPGWYRDAMGPMIAVLKETEEIVAVLPGGGGGYHYTDPRTGKRVRVHAHTAECLRQKAICFYRSFPMRPLLVRDLLKFMVSSLTLWDLAGFGLSAAAIALLGLLTPRLSRILTGPVVSTGSSRLLFAAFSFLLLASVTSILLNIIRDLLLSRIRQKLDVSFGAASMMRILSLPVSFFRSCSAGEMDQYLSYMTSLCGTVVDSVFSVTVSGLFSLVYFAQIFAFAPSLVWPSLIVTFLTFAVSLLSAWVQMTVDREKMACAARERGLVCSLISGIHEIRLSGAEQRAFDKWSLLYSKSAKLTYHPPAVVRLSSVFTTAISLAGTGVMYYVAIRNRVAVSDYFAFNAAYASVTTAFSALSSMALSAASIRPILALIRPLLAACPETAENKEAVSHLSGGIRLSHVSFSYDPDNSPLLYDLTLDIRPGEYVAIVGRSGSGKSTLLRLLLGFETPLFGSIFFDGKNLDGLELRSLRRRLGTVLQDDKLLSGSIFDNIAFSSPGLSREEAWEAAETAGIADDIRNMPMGMNTLLQEGNAVVSGGQRQRILIARAVASKPDILIFDEATSALDSITQQKITDALDQMNCTRIVIAHRLSAVRRCDRILVLHEGCIAEEGTYDELMKRKRLFAKLSEQTPHGASPDGNHGAG